MPEKQVLGTLKKSGMTTDIRQGRAMDRAKQIQSGVNRGAPIRNCIKDQVEGITQEDRQIRNQWPGENGQNVANIGTEQPRLSPKKINKQKEVILLSNYTEKDIGKKKKTSGRMAKKKKC
jgi:hypothetical protein